MKRDRATAILEEMLLRLCQQSADPAAVLVVRVDVFGSYARGALDPHDVDLNVILDHDAVDEMFDFNDIMAAAHWKAVKRFLVGRRPSINMLFERPETLTKSMPNLQLLHLWSRGDDLAAARSRLHSIRADPSAGRAPRDHTLPVFADVENWLPVRARRLLKRGVEVGAITIDRIDLPDAAVKHSLAARDLQERWKPGRPLHRAAQAVLAHYEQDGVDPCGVRLHRYHSANQRLRYSAGFMCKYVGQLPNWFAECDGIEHIEVPHLTMKQPLQALRIVAKDVSQFGDYSRFALNV